MFLVPSCFKYTRVFFVFFVYVCFDMSWHHIFNISSASPAGLSPTCKVRHALIIGGWYAEPLRSSHYVLGQMCRHKWFQCFFLGDVCGMQLLGRRFWSSSALNSGEHLNALNSLDSTREYERCKRLQEQHLSTCLTSPQVSTLTYVYKSLDLAALKIDQ